MDEVNYYIAQALWYEEANGVIITTRKKEELHEEFNEVILMDKYYIEAPAYAKNAMEDSYPWSVKITKEQAMLFMNNYQLASAYYQKVRYNK